MGEHRLGAPDRSGPAALPDEVRAELEDKRLLPVGRAPEPQPDGVSAERRRVSARGAMLGTAIGDALGRPAEGHAPHSLVGREKAFEDFQPWKGHTSGPIGTVTDDTQLTMCVARCLLSSGGRIDPEDLARELVDWLPVGRGKGATCVAAVDRLTEGDPWWRAGRASAGNGATMRTAPIGIAHGADVDALCWDAVLSASVTHADPMAVAGAVGHAWLVAHLAASDQTALDPTALTGRLAEAIDVVADPGAPERDWARRGLSGDPVRLADRVRAVPDHLGRPIVEAFDVFYNGAYVLETLPAALWCFLDAPDDPERSLVAAIVRGRDADTVASMAAAYYGALHGPEVFPDRWRDHDLEHRDELLRMADELAALASSEASSGA